MNHIRTEVLGRTTTISERIQSELVVAGTQLHEEEQRPMSAPVSPSFQLSPEVQNFVCACDAIASKYFRGEPITFEEKGVLNIVVMGILGVIRPEVELRSG